VVALDAEIALSAAHLGVAHKVLLADSVMLATTREYGAILWTQDADFEGIERVRHAAKAR
jgi:predicted nucleic acid-binding protein